VRAGQANSMGDRRRALGTLRRRAGAGRKNRHRAGKGRRRYRRASEQADSGIRLDMISRCLWTSNHRLRGGRGGAPGLSSYEGMKA